MDSFPLSMYLTCIILLSLLAYVGIDEFMRIITYLDLNFKFLMIKIEMYFMKKKLQKELNVSLKKWETYLEENKNV